MVAEGRDIGDRPEGDSGQVVVHKILALPDVPSIDRRDEVEDRLETVLPRVSDNSGTAVSRTAGG